MLAHRRAHSWVGLQAGKLEEMRQRFTTQWAPGVEAIVQQELGALPEFEKAIDQASYEQTKLPRILKQIALVMQDELQSLVLKSLGAYLALIGGYASEASEIAVPSHEWVHSLPPGHPALIIVTLKLDNSSLYFEPALDQARNSSPPPWPS